MPRLDNTSSITWEALGALPSTNDIWLNLLAGLVDEAPIIDVCWNCYDNGSLYDCFDIDHPDYDNYDYHCLVCGNKLIRVDN